MMFRATVALGLAAILAGALLPGAQPAPHDSQKAAPSRNAAQQPDGRGASRPVAAGDQRNRDAVERGRYLVHHVAMCVQCHSPRDAQGALIETRLLHGGRIPVSSPYPGLPWAFRAPRIGGLPGWEEGEIIQLLETGRTSSGWSPRPPMPPFRMTAQDAAAVVTYLKSL